MKSVHFLVIAYILFFGLVCKAFSQQLPAEVHSVFYQNTDDVKYAKIHWPEGRRLKLDYFLSNDKYAVFEYLLRNY